MTPDQPQPKKRSLLVFYIATGVVAALFIVGYFAWTPIRLWYCEQTIRPLFVVRGADPIELGNSEKSVERTKASGRLSRLGPQSLSAFRRLLAAAHPTCRADLIYGLGKPKHKWALPFLVELSSSDDKVVAEAAVATAKWITQVDFFEVQRFAPDIADLSIARKNFHDWWKREGKAKYGSLK